MWVSYTISLSFIEFSVMMKLLIKYYLKSSKLGQILHADKTGFTDSVTICLDPVTF